MTKKDPFRRGRLLLWLCEEHQGQQPLLAGQRHDAPGKRPAQLLSELMGTPHVTKSRTRNLGTVLLLTNLRYYTKSNALNQYANHFIGHYFLTVVTTSAMAAAT